MPPKKGRYITAAACARAGKADLHRAHTSVSSAPASSEENGSYNSDIQFLIKGYQLIAFYSLLKGSCQHLKEFTGQDI
jgi:hypothetical protein